MRLIRLFKRDLAKEIAAWVDSELISAEQARSICRLYGVDFGSVKGLSAGYNLLVSLGYLFVGLSLITLIGANWDDIPRGVRLAGILVLTLGTQGLALRACTAERSSRATGLFLLGNLFYGAAIILIAQVYHLGEHMPDGVFWWALGSLPFGILLRDAWLTLFSCLLAGVWYCLEFGMGYFPVLFPVFLAGAVYVLVRGRASALLFLTTVVGIGMWVEGLLSVLWTPERHRLDIDPEHLPVMVALFVLAYGFSQWLHARDSAKTKDYGALLSLWTLRFGLVALFILTFDEPWKEMIRENWPHQASMWLVVAALFGASLWFGHKTNSLQVLLPITVFCGASMLSVVYLDDTAHALYLQTGYNIAFVAAGIWLIVRGINSGISHYFFLGVVSILLIALVRYIDLIGDYIGGAILFMVLAGLLLGSAKYWKASQTRRAGEVQS